jgi:CRP-like cAMP-binding protein
MITAEVIRYLNTITEFKEDELQIIEPFLQDKTMQKGEPLLEEGQICDDIYLVLSGVLRNYYNNNGTDVNLSFTFANQCTTNFEAYINREPSKIIIEALEKSRIVVIKSKLLRRQNKSVDSVATFIRRLAIRILLTTEEHHNMMMMKQPSDRYQYVLQKKPALIQKVSLTHLSSYLGMSRETLSRIRSNKY